MNFTYAELAMLNRMVGAALMSGKIELNEVSESVHKKIRRDMRHNNVNSDSKKRKQDKEVKKVPKLKPKISKQKISKQSKLGLDWLGKTVTHKNAGEGIVVGYSNITGEPFAYFYSMADRKEICCFSHKDVISVDE